MSPQSTRRLGFLALGLALLVVALSAFLSALTWKRLSADGIVEASQHLQDLNLAIRMEISDAERDQFGYLLTGSDAYRRSSESRMQRIPGIIDELLRSAAGSPGLRSKAGALQELTNQKVAMLRHGIALRSTKGLAAALEVVRAGAGRDLSDRIDAVSREIDTEQDTDLDRSYSALAQAEQILGWLNLGSALVLTALVACAALALTRALNRQQALMVAAEHSRDLLRTTLYSIGDAVIVTDEKGGVRMMNPVAERMTGRSENDAAGFPTQELFSVLDADDRTPRSHPVDRVLRQDGAGSCAENAILKRNDGGEIPIGESGAPIIGPQGDLQGVVLVLRDMTESKAADEAVRESEQRFRTLADSAPVMIWTETPEQQRDYFNLRWLEYRGRTLEQEAGTGWMEGIHPEDVSRTRQHMRGVRQSQQPYSVEYRLRRADGRYGWVLSRGVPRFDASGRFLAYIGTTSDIDEIKEADQKLIDAAKLESLGVLAGGIAHDFNNILVGILGSACLLEEYVPEDSPGRELVVNLQQSGDRAAKLTRQMLAYSGRGRFYLEALDLSEQVREVWTLLKASAPKNVEIRLKLSGALPAVQADATQVQQVIANLVVNSAEAMPPLGGWIEVSTYTETVHDDTAGFAAGLQPLSGEHVVLQVSDNGSGIDAETIPKIFDPFFSTRFAGRGLGLAATLGIMRSHHGAIKVDSSPGEGATFRLYFPAVTAKRQREA